MSSETKRTLALEIVGEPGVRLDLSETKMLVVGSSRERADLLLLGQGVEDVHFAIGRVKAGGWALKDLGSRGGTRLNGEAVAQARVGHGDLIAIGARRLRVVDPAQELVEQAAFAETRVEPRTEPDRASARRIGGFRVEQLIGKGSMGEVYLAVQESLNRPVALKILSPALAADSDFVRRFQDEARAAAALSHPNVVVVHDVGAAQGEHFLVMEFMAGGSLETRVAAGGPLPWRAALDVLCDAARGLTFAEEKRIIHRDIKPANLMIAGSGTVKIADLGLATSLEAEATLDLDKKIFGTPHFVSPEQARGESVDHRSDLYSLGATAYRVLTGHTPFEGETTREILRKHFTEIPARPSTLVPGIPPALDLLVLKLLAKEPAGRYPSAALLLADLERIKLASDHGPTMVPAGGARSRGLPWASLLLLVGAGAVFLVYRERSERLRPPTPPANDGTPVVAAVDDHGFFDTEPGATGGDPENDALLKNLEREAQLALREAQLTLRDANSGLTLDEHRAVFERIAKNYEGTSAATDALAQAEELRQEFALLESEAARIAELRTSALALLARKAGWPPEAGALPRPGDALRAIAADLPPPEIAFDPQYLLARAALAEEVVTESHAIFAAILVRAAALAAEGDFAGVERMLSEINQLFTLPTYEAGSAPPGFTALVEQGEEVLARLSHLEADAKAHGQALHRAARLSLASAFGPGSDAGSLLESFDLALLELRARGLAGELADGEMRAQASALADDFALARSAFDALTQTFAASQWRRRSVPDTRGRRSSAVDVVGTTSEGLLVEENGSSAEVFFAEFAARCEWLHQLFHERLTRPWTAHERASIAALLRLAAVRECALLAQQVLDTERHAILQESEAAAMLEAFAHASEWVEGSSDEPAQRARLELERQAAERLSRALVAYQSKDWSNAVATLEALIAEQEGALLVLLFADGSDWQTPPEAPAQREAAPTVSPDPTQDEESSERAPSDGSSEGGR